MNPPRPVYSKFGEYECFSLLNTAGKLETFQPLLRLFNRFGCSNDADFTYFGKAYFDALQQTYSFSDAFELAKPVIASREREAHYDQSDPRISVGPSIKTALEDFVRQRESSVKAKSAAVMEVRELAQ